MNKGIKDEVGLGYNHLCLFPVFGFSIFVGKYLLWRVQKEDNLDRGEADSFIPQLENAEKVGWGTSKTATYQKCGLVPLLIVKVGSYFSL